MRATHIEDMSATHIEHVYKSRLTPTQCNRLEGKQCAPHNFQMASCGAAQQRRIRSKDRLLPMGRDRAFGTASSIRRDWSATETRVTSLAITIAAGRRT